jgi:2-hydroxylaminobenzoate mutase
MPATTESLLALLDTPMAAAAAVDLADALAARAELERRYPFDGRACRALRAALLEALAAGVIGERGKDPVRYSRLAKPGATRHDLSVDFVWMSGPGIPHRHPRGEVNLCFAVDVDASGAPRATATASKGGSGGAAGSDTRSASTARFDGQPQGWVAFPPDSRHVPTVTGGRMLIAYFLPGGEVEWI